MPLFLLLCSWLALASEAPPPMAQSASPAPLAPAHPIAENQLPPELAAWIPWVLSQHPDHGCPLVGTERVCAWPGALAVDATPEGARLTLDVTLDRDQALSLPGGKGQWPQDVRAAGKALTVLDVGGVPTVALPAGRHTVQARIAWGSRPQALSLPAGIGQLSLTVDGERVARPVLDEQGLRLGAGEADTRQDQRLDVEVSRQVRDGVPVVIETRLTLRASGSGREVDLGDVLVQGTRPTQLNATLPARFSTDGQLVVQVRPGTYALTFQAVHDGPVEALTAPAPGGAWPTNEYWVVQANDRVRAANVSGAPGIDPARTTLPEAWRSLPAYVLTPGQALAWETLRRGEPTPPPNRLSLTRQLWLDADGGGWTVQDRISGELHQGWRLDTQSPLVLGSASNAGQSLVVTEGDSAQGGVELREERVNLQADSRIEGTGGALPAVGWDADVTSLSATVHLPPGWQLLTATGVDSLDGSVLDAWTLFDLFFVLVVAMALGRLLGWQWGLLALVGLVLSRHSDGAPQWTWAVLVAISALARVMPEGWPSLIMQWTRYAALVALALILVPFAVEQVQVGLFPALEQDRDSWDDYSNRADTFSMDMMEAEMAGSAAPQEEADWSRARKVKKPAAPQSSSRYLSQQVDPAAVVQTGPGVPTWRFHTQPLSWSGPVARDHTMRLVLLSPLMNLILALLRVGLLVALGLRIAELRALLSKRALAAAAMLLLVPSLARAEPSETQLRELEARLLVPPACAPDCADLANARMTVRGERLTIAAEVHAAADTAVKLPGPTKTWVPATVRLDGQVSTALRRTSDGFLELRLPAGVHRVELEGGLPASDAITLEFPDPPAWLDWEGDGWALDGRRADGTVEGSVQLARVLSAGGAGEAQSSENLAPWFEVHRTLDLGLPWRVRTEVVRVGPTDHPISVKVPLLPGEAITEGDYETRDGMVSVTLERDQPRIGWVSALDEREQLVLTAPEGAAWTEQWTLLCAPMFRCTHAGPAPQQHTVSGSASPVWRVWPGEQVQIDVSRPAGVEGQTVTVDRAQLELRLGRRQLEAQLDLGVRSSQGGQQVLTLPPGAQLQQVTIDNRDRPLQLRDDNQLHVPLEPGSQSVRVTWQQAHPESFVDTMPAVDLGSPAVNVEVTVQPVDRRWIIALFGPRWGPVPLYWTLVLLVVLAAPMLTRLPFAPLSTWQWALLGLGMTQVGPWPMFVVAAWFVGLGWRQQRKLDSWWQFDLMQLWLLFWTFVTLVCLYAAVHVGLLIEPDTQVAGNQSYNQLLKWFVDRSTGAMPQPTLVTAPLWVWRVLMLVWSLWLAASLVRWLPWAWRAWSHEGILARPPKPPRPEDPISEPAES